MASFDAAVGLGHLVDSAGGSWPFHCVSIRDGSRTIEVGVPVAFVSAFCTLRREAVDLTPVKT